MAEYNKIMHIYHRLCDSELCGSCPVGPEKNGHQLKCERFMINYPDEFENICLKWDKENPELTNRSKLFEVLKETFGEQVALTILPELSCSLFSCDDMDCDHCCYNGFWDKPYKKED